MFTIDLLEWSCYVSKTQDLMWRHQNCVTTCEKWNIWSNLIPNWMPFSNSSHMHDNKFNSITYYESCQVLLLQVCRHSLVPTNIIIVSITFLWWTCSLWQSLQVIFCCRRCCLFMVSCCCVCVNYPRLMWISSCT